MPRMVDPDLSSPAFKADPFSILRGPVREALSRNMLDLDEPDHRRLRILVQKASRRASSQRCMRGSKQSLDYLEKNVGPYREAELHMVEVPSNWGFGGFAMPGMILLNESRVMLIDDRNPDRPDLLLRRVAHEVAHQWFGHQVAPANADGGLALVESLTKYCELMILERVRGRDQVQRLVGMELDRYLKGRASEANKETPLYKVGDDQPYLYYSKGSLIMYAIRELIGEESVTERCAVS